MVSIIYNDQKAITELSPTALNKVLGLLLAVFGTRRRYSKYITFARVKGLRP